MRLSIVCALLACASASLSACGGGTATTSAPEANNRPAQTAQKPSTHAPEATPPAATLPAPSTPPVASSHGGAGASAAPSGSAAPAAAGQGRPSSAETAALDAKVAGALAKAKAPKAGAADRRAAAQAYLERANFYWGAGNPSLYKFALADFKSVLVYDPGNAEAATKRDEIVRIYRSMNRPVPELSNEP